VTAITLANTNDFVEVADVRSIDDQGRRAQVIDDLEAFARDPQRRTLEAVLDSVGVTNSSLSLQHPSSRTHDLRDSYGRAQVGHLSDGRYGALLDQVRQQAPRWLAQIRDQASEAAKVARATYESMRGVPDAERVFLAKAIAFKAEADQATRAAILAKVALANRRPRPARTRGDVRDAPEMLFKRDGIAAVAYEPAEQARREARGEA
jgi:hypothetical protein